MHGDIAYFEVKTKEDERYPITASTAGYYVNGGMKKDGEIEYERESDVFPSLISLLKAKSAHFTDVINKKVYFILLLTKIAQSKMSNRSPNNSRVCSIINVYVP